MISEEQHHKSKLSNDRCHKPHLCISKILDETQTRTMSFRDWNGMDGLGFDFGISLLMLQTVMVVRLLISPARWAWRRGSGWRLRSLGAELICESGLIRWLWMWIFFFFTAVVCGCGGSSWWLVATMVGGCGGFFFFFLWCCLWLQWIWLVAGGSKGG